MEIQEVGQNGSNLAKVAYKYFLISKVTEQKFAVPVFMICVPWFLGAKAPLQIASVSKWVCLSVSKSAKSFETAVSPKG